MDSEAMVLDITERSEYERYLYKCLAPMPFRKYWKRQEYLETAISRGFHKKILIFHGEVVGQIEYAPAEASYYPILGDNVTVMNCIWVLRKARGHNFGRQLFNDMVRSEKNAKGFATIGLGGHWSPWLIKWQMEKLFSFKSIDSMEVRHKLKHTEECFRIHLMWLPIRRDSKLPIWDREKLLEGIQSCTAHPLYHPERVRQKDIFEKC